MPILFGLEPKEFFSLIFLIVFLFYAVYSAFLIYHWYSFGYTKKANSLASLSYLLGSAVLIFIMALSIFTM